MDYSLLCQAANQRERRGKSVIIQSERPGQWIDPFPSAVGRVKIHKVPWISSDKVDSLDPSKLFALRLNVMIQKGVSMKARFERT
jgi:hypothetical protein